MTTASLAVLGALAGLGGAVIVTLNRHILVGLEDGYIASPTQVLESSVWLLGMDAVILVAAPVLAVILVLRLRRSISNTR